MIDLKPKYPPLVMIKRAKVELQKEKPFFSDLIFYLKLVEANPKENWRFETMAIDGVGNLYFNPEWVDKLSPDEIKGVLCHEVCHLAFLHIPRGEKKREQFIWNLAIDCQANFIVVKNNMRLPSECGCLPDVYSNSVKIMSKNAVVYEVQDIENKSAEKVYLELLENLPRGDGEGEGKGKGGRKSGKGSGRGGIEGNGRGGYKGGFDEHLDNTDKKSAEDKGKELSKEDIQRLQQAWKDRLINSIYRAQGCGHTPLGIDRLVKDLLEPRIDWRAKLYKHISDGLPSDFTFRKPHKRSGAVGHYCPSYVKEALRVGVFIDTSGSIGEDELKQFKSECVGIAKSFDSVSMVLGYIDTEMYPPIDVDNGNIQQIIESTPKGGGGTDMRQVFQFIDKTDNCKDLEVVIILTDADTPMPKPSEVRNRKVLWVVPKRSEEYAKKRIEGKDIGDYIVIE
jgi:predicted metal-dependent peptidase